MPTHLDPLSNFKAINKLDVLAVCEISDNVFKLFICINAKKRSDS